MSAVLARGANFQARMGSGSGVGRIAITSKMESREAMRPGLAPSGAGAGPPGPRVDARKAWTACAVAADIPSNGQGDKRG